MGIWLYIISRAIVAARDRTVRLWSKPFARIMTLLFVISLVVVAYDVYFMATHPTPVPSCLPLPTQIRMPSAQMQEFYAVYLRDGWGPDTRKVYSRIKHCTFPD
jgi:hypothetical protein